MISCTAAGAGPSLPRSIAGSTAVAPGLVIYESGYLPVRRAHADALIALQRLALGLQRRCDDDLRAVELGEILVAARRHRGAQTPEQVERTVVLARRTDQDLLERPVLRRRHARAARKRGMEGRH